MKGLGVFRIVIAAVTFGVWVVSAIELLVFDRPIDQGVFILTVAVFIFVFGPGAFGNFLVIRKNGNGNGKENDAHS